MNGFFWLVEANSQPPPLPLALPPNEKKKEREKRRVCVCVCVWRGGGWEVASITNHQVKTFQTNGFGLSFYFSSVLLSINWKKANESFFFRFFFGGFGLDHRATESQNIRVFFFLRLSRTSAAADRRDIGASIMRDSGLRASIEFSRHFRSNFFNLMSLRCGYWVAPNFTGFNQVLPSFTGFYLVLLGFTRFYLALLSFTKFYWVLPDFT